MLSDEGYQQLRRRGHAHVASACAPAPAGRTRFLDPRHAREVAAAGTAQCTTLFLAPWPDLPVVLERSASADRTAIELRVPPDLRTLRGHFSALPIVPGVIHVAWALQFAREDLGVSTVLAGMDQVKFRHIVQPGQQLTLSVSWLRQPHTLSFVLGTPDRAFSSGRLVLAASDA